MSNVPLVVEESTADTAVFLILAALRGFNNGILAIRAGTWLGKVPPGPLGHDPQGKILGILGMGGIGRNLKRKAEVFGMRCIYHNRTELSAIEADGAGYVSFDELLARSDVLSLNLPLNVSPPFRFQRGLVVDRHIGSHEEYHIHARVCQDEARYHHCKYCSRRSA